MWRKGAKMEYQKENDMDWDEDEIENAFVEWDKSLSATIREIAMSSPRVFARLAWRAAWIAALQRANPTAAG
jgi:hypothetical protein